MVLRPDRGGVFNHVVRLSSALAERGHEVAVCGPLEHRAHDLPVELIQLDIGRPVSPFSDVRAVVGLGRIIRRFQPDLVHAHGSKGGTFTRLARIASPRTPVVFTPHLYAFDNYFVRGAQRRVYRLVERTLAPLATLVLCVCEAERELAAQIGPAGRTRVVHNGIEALEPAPTHPLVAELGEEGPVIAAVAELRVSKGIVTLIEAMPSVLAEHPQCRLAIAGDGEQRPAIERRIEELGIAHAVRLLGLTEGPQEVLSGAFAFVNPAYAEAFPYTVIEAMSAGVPIVATNVGGTGEAIEDGVTGFLVPPKDPGALAGGIKGLLADRELAERLGRDAAHRYRQRFTLERMIEGTLAVYDEVGIR